jgi:CTP synthase
MRLGKQSSILEKSLTREIYDTCGRLGKQSSVQEKFRHRYELHPDYAKKFHNTDFHIAGVSKKEGIVQFLELDTQLHPFYIGTQAHPELNSYLEDPAPLFVGLIKSILSTI